LTATQAIADGPGGGTRRRRPRRCVARRQPRDRSHMIRFVVAPDGQVVADVDERLPGRGLWLSAERDVLNMAVARNLFAKALRAPVRAGPELVDRIEATLAARCADLIGLARRAGQVSAGFDQVRAALRSGQVAVLVMARDAAADGRRRMQALAAGLPLVTALDRETLGRALGRGPTVFAAVAPGGLARRLCRAAARLEGFRPGSLVQAPGDDDDDNARRPLPARAGRTKRNS
jgi:uncharacterized protein